MNEGKAWRREEGIEGQKEGGRKRGKEGMKEGRMEGRKDGRAVWKEVKSVVEKELLKIGQIYKIMEKNEKNPSSFQRTSIMVCFFVSEIWR